LSAFVDAKYALTAPDSSAVRVFQLIDSIQAFTKRHPKEVLFSTSAADLRRAKKDGKIAVFIGVEGGHAIRGSLDTLRVLAAKGVRYMTLTWNNGNSWAGAARGVNGTSTAGLTEFGKEVVRTMNDLGILVDVSHVSRQTFYDAIAASRVPVIASHSSSRALTDVPRNLDDDQLRAVAKNGGVVNVNFYSDFVRTSGKSGDPVPFSVLIDHFDHIAKVAGVDHVGIGSDFDGIDAAPQGIDDVTSLPRIAQALLDRGYSEADLLKMLGGNMLRVLDESVDHRAETMRKRAGAN
jgi:membrane dipeptidase